MSFIGELALLRVEPEAFGQLWDRTGRLPSIEDQRFMIGTDGVAIGSVLMDRWGLPEELSDGVRIRQLSFTERLAHSEQGLNVSLGLGTAIAELLTGGGAVLQTLGELARAWGISEEDLLGFWADFKAAALQTTQQLGLDLGSEIGAMIEEAKGAYVLSPVAHVTEPAMPDSDLETARKVIEDLREENDRLEGLSLQDSLTGVPNPLAFVGHLQSSLAQMTRDPAVRRVGVAMFDLDHFKQVNDTHGHLAGDQLLGAVSSAGLRAARQNELFARLGGDEFAMVFRPEDEAELGLAVERVREAVKDGAAREGGVQGTTVSAGAAILERFEGDIDAAATLVTQAADDALYAAKRAGRDRSQVATALPEGLTVTAYSTD